MTEDHQRLNGVGLLEHLEGSHGVRHAPANPMFAHRWEHAHGPAHDNAVVSTFTRVATAEELELESPAGPWVSDARGDLVNVDHVARVIDDAGRGVFAVAADDREILLCPGDAHERRLYMDALSAHLDAWIGPQAKIQVFSIEETV